MVNARNEITQVVRPRKVSRKIDPDWGEEVHKSILLNKKKNTLAKQSRHKEFVISNGILAFTKREEKLLNHIGIRAFLAIMRGNGLLGTSIELSLKNLSIWMNKFGELKGVIATKKKAGENFNKELTVLVDLEKKINTQIATVQVILDKGEQSVLRMSANLRIFVEDFEKTLSLVRRMRKSHEKGWEEEDLVAVTRTAISYLKRNVLPVFKDLYRGYSRLRKNIPHLLNKAWKVVKDGKKVSHEKIAQYYNITNKELNKVLATAEKDLKVNKQEEKYLEIISNLAIRIASSSAAGKVPHKGKPASIRVSSEKPKPKITQKYNPKDRLSIAKPTKPAKSFWKPWTWFK